MMDAAVAVGIAALIAASLLVGMCVWLAIKKSDLENLAKRQAAVIKRLRSPLRDQSHADQWNYLWQVIREKFNIFVCEDKTWNGGQPAKEILKLLRAEFGNFNKDQIYLLTQVVTLIRQVMDNQKERELALNPVGKDIVFDAEGGYRIISLKPSDN